MNAQQMIALLEKQLKLDPYPKRQATNRGNNVVTSATPKAQDDACPRCGGDSTGVFTLETGTRFCLNCGEL